ncbi:MAG: NTPase [Candidatus Bathyarchaeia archaeon]
MEPCFKRGEDALKGKRVILLTGPPRSGKSTVAAKTAELLKSMGFKVGGVLTLEMVGDRGRIGFKLLDLWRGREGILALAGLGGPRIGKYGVNLGDLRDIGAGAIDIAIQECDLIIIDEIGPMELLSEDFRGSVARALECGKPVLATIHYRMEDRLVREAKSRGDSILIEVSPSNRGELPAKLREAISNLLGGGLR